MVCIMVAYPMNYNPFRQHFVQLIFKREEFSQTFNTVMTLSFLSITCFISIIFPNVSQVISILGGMIATSMCYLVPTIIQVKLSKEHWTHYTNLGAILFFGTLVLIGYTSVGIIIYEIVNDIKEMPRQAN
mmetsp:Transcript_3214/g.5359  ORF Transcript_3214/g.5359 Transcript_3214/m.5359 type:complete len:130 (+) Transcript_3214:1205-1594(+)